jgi:hypothetical protein
MTPDCLLAARIPKSSGPPCSWPDLALESWVLRLQPVAAFPAPIEAALSLRHDALKAELAGLGEHDRAFGGERLAEQDAFDAGDEQQERASPPLERTQAHILAFETQKVEGHKCETRYSA